MVAHENILLPLDGSARAERILPVAQQLSQVLPAKLTLVRVIAADASEMDEADADRYLRELARGLTQSRGVSSHVLRGDAVAEILGLARRIDTSYVMLSTHGRSGISRWLMGSVAQALIRAARVPVIVQNDRAGSLAMAREGDRGPADYSPLTLGWRVADNTWPPRAILDGGPIVVPLDGSALAEAVLPVANTLAERLGRSLHLVEVIPPALAAGALPVAAGGRPTTVSEATRAEALVTLDATGTRLRAASRSASAEQRFGLPAEEILAAAAEQRASLIALATHGRTGVARAVLGSVADTVLRLSPRPVMLLGPGAMRGD